jgi:ankyrin repeat protein
MATSLFAAPPPAAPLLKDGLTALHKACANGHSAVVEAFLAKGACIEENDQVSSLVGKVCVCVVWGGGGIRGLIG